MNTGLEGSYVIKQNKKLALGYTTGSCSAAAAKAAAKMLFTQKNQDFVDLMTPKGIMLHLKVLEQEFTREAARCAIKKDAGDDPDVTNGVLVYAKVALGSPEGVMQKHNTPSPYIVILGGTGVGRVTKPGLEQKVGEAAINRVPRRMIREGVAQVCEEAGYRGDITVEISIPAGLELAEKTFNPRLGIEGGISVLGTSGIVEPMSEAALIETIRLEMQMRRNNGAEYLLAAPGNYGMAYLSAHTSLSLEQAVKYSNYVGELIDFAVELGFRGLLMVSHMGKLIKVAGGIMNTHSRNGDARMELLAANALRGGAEGETLQEILRAVTTDEGLAVLNRGGFLEETMKHVMEQAHSYLDRRAYGHLQIGVIAFSNEWGKLGQAGPVEELTKALAEVGKIQK